MNPLRDVLSPKARKVLYAVLFVLALGFGAWKAAEGDVVEAIAGFVTMLYGAMAASNTPSSPRADLETTTVYVPEHRA